MKKVVCLAVLVAFFGTFVTPELFAQYQDENWKNKGNPGMGRALFGAAGLAAGAYGGTALAAAITGAAGGALVGLPGIIATTCIVAGLGLVGAKLGSAGGEWVDSAMGPDMMWTLGLASIGAMLGLMFIPGMAFAGAMAPLLKVLIGGFAGGIIGKMFSRQLQSVATPKLIFAGLGGLVGGLGFGIPGALAGVVGGYFLGGLFDRNFFTQPGRTISEELGVEGLGRSIGNVGSWFKNRAEDVKDWVSNRSSNFTNRMQNSWNDDSYYYHVKKNYDTIGDSVYDQNRNTHPEYLDYSGGQYYAPNKNYDANATARKQAVDSAYRNMMRAKDAGDRDGFERWYREYTRLKNQY